MATAGAAPLEASQNPAAPPSAVRWAIATAGSAAAGASVVFALSNESIGAELGEPLVIAFLWTWTTLAYVLGGLVAWSRRPASRLGPLMIATGAVCFLVTLAWTSSDATYTVGQALDLLPAVVFLHVCLAFPGGRLEGRFVRGLVAAAYAAAVGLQLAKMRVGDFGPHNLLGSAPHPDALVVIEDVQLGVLSACCLAGVAVLATRRRRDGAPLRRTAAAIVDAFTFGLVMIAALYVSEIFSLPVSTQIRWAAVAILGLAPAAFVAGLLHERLARSSVGDLVVALQDGSLPAELRDALARSLRDPSLALVYWLPEFECWADSEGSRIELPEAGSGKVATRIDRDGQPMAALVHDPALEDEPELLAAVGAAAGIALENARLQAEQRAHLEELKGSRARVIDAGQQERKRLERNLHDGAQQRLIALSLDLSLLERQLAGDAAAAAQLGRARSEIAVSLEELRTVARGLHPAVLSGHGLKVALESLAAQSPTPVTLTVGAEGRLPEPIEVAAYYVVSESLANIGKHAHARSATVDVTRAARLLVVDVADDGVGGADTERGSGLRGLADRVEAHGGRLRIWSPPGGGTRLRAELPCG